MAVGEREPIPVLFTPNCLITVIGIFAYALSTVLADRPLKESPAQDERNHEDYIQCERDCEHGCCENTQCCDPPSRMSSYSVQVIAIVGACLVTLILLFLCFVRYRMMAKIRNNTRARCARANRLRSAEAGRADGARTASTGTGTTDRMSVCSINLPPQYRASLWNSLGTLMLLERAHRLSSSTSPSSSPPPPEGLLVTPPPYSENDPHALVLDPSGYLQLPPAYEDVIKASTENENENVNETVTTTTTETTEPLSSPSSSSPSSSAVEESGD